LRIKLITGEDTQFTNNNLCALRTSASLREIFFGHSAPLRELLFAALRKLYGGKKEILTHCKNPLTMQ
jgi:hypothetical protein